MNLEGPELRQHPPPVTYFSNSVGVTLKCTGAGHPPLSTKWLTADGNHLTEIPGIRFVLIAIFINISEVSNVIFPNLRNDRFLDSFEMQIRYYVNEISLGIKNIGANEMTRFYYQI